MVGRGDAHGVELFAGEHLAEVFVLDGCFAGRFFDVIGGPVAVLAIHIADRGEFDGLAFVFQLAQGLHVCSEAAPARPDKSDADFSVAVGRFGGFLRRRRQARERRRRHRAGTCCFEKISS